jgi:urease accessory protein
MFDAQPCHLAAPPPTPGPPALARSAGSLRLTLKRRGDLTVADRFFQSGCLKARFAAPDPRQTADIILVNTAGGLTGGDNLAIDIGWGQGTQSTVTTQAAEKIYRSIVDAVRVTTVLEIGPDACGEWLPQETILFNRAALERDITVHLARGARFLGLEAVIFGRSAMGETVVVGRLRDAWRVRREGRLIYADAFDINGAIAETLRKRAVAGGANALATLLWIDPEAATMRDRLRAVFGDEVGFACSSWEGMLAIRFAASAGATLRHHIVQTLGLLRPGRTLPRLWQC